jgi:hypothetical protein
MATDLVYHVPTLEPVTTGVWRLVYDWTVRFRGEYYSVPTGWETDGASIPRWLWPVCGHPLEVTRLYAALLHDYLYAGGDPEATRADADALYRDLLIALGVSRWKAYIEWTALRTCGWTHWHENTNKKEGTKMNKMIMIAAFAAVVGIAGCKSVEVERHAQTLATWCDTNGVHHVFCDATGKPIILDGGWEVSYFQHWNWQRFDALTASAGPGVTLTLNGYESGADSNLVALVKTSFDGAALLAAKVGAAIATSGGSAGVEGVAAMVRQFVAKGGDVSKAAVNCANGACTISDGAVTETCTECFVN